MKRNVQSAVRCSVLVLALCLVATSVAGAAPYGDKSTKAAKQTKAEPAQAQTMPKADAAHDSMMTMMMKMAATGPQHAALAKCAGQWKAVVKSWSGPGEPSVSEGVSDNAMILGGRYLEQRFKSSMMNMPFEGYGLNGFDNATQRYWSTWVDNMSTSVMVAWGTMDEASHTMTMTASMPGPDGKPMDMKLVTKFPDDNTQVFSMYGMMNGQEMLMMEISYTRM